MGIGLRDWRFKIYLYEDFNPEYFITGFKGIGQVGYLSIRYLVENLDGIRRVGLVDSIYAQPVVNVGINGRLLYPIEIYLYENIGIVRFEDVSLDYRGSYLIKEFIKWVASHKNPKLILIGGLVSTLKEDESDIARVVYNSYWDMEVDVRYAQDNVRILGPLAHAIYYAEIYRVPTLAILAYANPESIVDPRGVYNALETLKKIVKIDVDTGEILETAKEIEERLSKIAEDYERSERKYMYT